MSNAYQPQCSFGVLCLSQRSPSGRIERDDEAHGPSGGSPVAAGLAAALPYLGAAIGLILGQIALWLISSH